MYTQEQEQLRMGLVQFLGSILSSSNFAEPEMRRQSVVALVTEELVKICKNQDNNIDMVAAKPILKATQHILSTRESEIRQDLADISMDDDFIEEAVSDISWIKEDLEKYINTIE